MVALYRGYQKTDLYYEHDDKERPTLAAKYGAKRLTFKTSL